jgi:hypothetical protein
LTAVIVNVIAAEVPPPGVGVTTVTAAVPPLAMSLAGIWAVSCVALANVVDTGVPFQFTTDAETKLDPFAVKVNPLPPGAAVVGLIEVSAGAGFAAVLEDDEEDDDDVDDDDEELVAPPLPPPPQPARLLRATHIARVAGVR